MTGGDEDEEDDDTGWGAEFMEGFEGQRRQDMH